MSRSDRFGAGRRLSSPGTKVPPNRLATRATLVVALVVGVVAGLTGLVSSPASAQRKLAGTLTLTVASTHGEPCADLAAYPDLRNGIAIVVRDSSGNSVGTGRLGVGAAKGLSCVRQLELGPVPVLAEYRLTIGATGPFVVTADALQASGDLIDLRFGA